MRKAFYLVDQWPYSFGHFSRPFGEIFHLIQCEGQFAALQRLSQVGSLCLQKFKSIRLGAAVIAEATRCSLQVLAKLLHLRFHENILA